MFSPCQCYCSLCREPMDYMKSYGRIGCCCSQKCYREFEWRHTLSILGKTYYPQPPAPDTTEPKVTS